MSVTEPVKKYNVLASTTKTKKNMNVIKNIKSWCKLIIPSITGVAASWKPNCQGEEESSNKQENIVKIKTKKNMGQLLKNGFEPSTIWFSIKYSKPLSYFS